MSTPKVPGKLPDPCPFVSCRSMDTMLTEFLFEHVFTEAPIRSWRVVCRQCDARGPWGGDGEEGKLAATERWNRRTATAEFKRPKIAPCPFVCCASENTVVWEQERDTAIPGVYRQEWRAICRGCGAQGPWGGAGESGKYFAAERWNGRVFSPNQAAVDNG